MQLSYASLTTSYSTSFQPLRLLSTRTFKVNNEQYNNSHTVLVLQSIPGVCVKKLTIQDFLAALRQTQILTPSHQEQMQLLLTQDNQLFQLPQLPA